MARRWMRRRSLRAVPSGMQSRLFTEPLEGRTLLSASILDVAGSDYVVTRPAVRSIANQSAPGDVGGSGNGAAGYQIQIVFPDNTLTASQKAVFTTAAARWQSIILGELPDVTADFDDNGTLETIDDIRISASGPAIDGPGGILGQAGPEFIRDDPNPQIDGLTITGVMQFDSADLATLQANGQLNDVILHEMGHVLGLGTLWDLSTKNLISGAGTSNPRYTGALGNAQYQAIFGLAAGTQAPIENTGGGGTRDGHWREGTASDVNADRFDRELMTGFLDSGVVNPLSRITIAQFADLGYRSVNVNGFDVFNPTFGTNNAYPTIASLSDSQDPVPPNSSFTLTANSVADSNGSISNVKFYRETNGIAGLQVLTGTVGDIQGDLLLGTDSSSSGGFTQSVSTTGLANGTYTYYAQATDNQNLVSVNVSTTNTVGSVSATPGTPDLVAATDTGTSNTDNITNRDNSTAAKNLQFSVTGTVSGATVSIYSSGTFIGSAVASGTTTTVTTNGTVDLADGGRSITARQTESGKSESPDSSALSITIDTAVPTADVTDVTPDPRSTGVSAIAVVFNEAVTGVNLADFSLTRAGGSNLLTASQTVTTGDNTNFSVNNLQSLTDPNGAYVFTLTASGSSITDTAGNALAVNASDSWTNNNVAPTIASLSDTPDPVTTGQTLTLTANTVADGNSDALTVNFYRETNSVAGLQVGGDTLVGSDTSSPYSIGITAPAVGSYTYYAQATDTAGLTSTVVSTTNTVQGAASAVPGTPDLVAATDTGSSSTDNITNRDNSVAGKTLQFSVTGTISGATVSIYSSGTFIGSAVASGTTTTVTTNGTVDLADGTRSITARQTETGKTESADSSALSITVDTVGPTADVVDVSEPRTTPVASVNVTFNEAVTGFTAADLTLTRDGNNVALTGSNDPTTSDNINWNIPNLTTPTNPSGTYVLSVASGAVNDLAGNALSAGASDTWVNSNALPVVTDVFVSSTAWNANFFSFLNTSGQGDSVAGYRLLAADHADELPWVNLNKISIRFSENVNVASDDLVVRGINLATYPILASGGFSYDQFTFTATWTLDTTGLPNDKLLLDLDADAGTGVTDINTNQLDGEWTNPASSPSTPGGADTFPSGNGTAGGDFRFRINVLPGDVNRSGGSVTGSDVTLVRNNQNFSPGTGGYTVFRDVNGSASILGSDVTLVRNRQGLSLPAGEPTAPSIVLGVRKVSKVTPVLKASVSPVTITTLDALTRKRLSDGLL